MKKMAERVKYGRIHAHSHECGLQEKEGREVATLVEERKENCTDGVMILPKFIVCSTGGNGGNL